MSGITPVDEKKWIQLLFNILLSIAVAVLTIGFLFMLDLLATSAVGQISFFDKPNQNVRIPVAEFHHGLGANKKLEEGWGKDKYFLTTNSLGFRDSKNREISTKSNKKRILFIGDSFTEAVGVPYDESFVGLIDNYFAEKNVEVLNAGTSSYCSIIYWRKIKYLIEEVKLGFDQVVVMLDISDIYDSTLLTLDRNGNVVKRNLLKRTQDFVEANTTLFRSISKYLYSYYVWIKWTHFAEGDASGLGINDYKSLWTVNDNMWEAYGRVGIKNEEKYLSELLEILRSRGVALTLAVYPWPDQIWHKDLQSKHVRHWRQWSERNNVKFIDLFPLFLDLNPENPSSTIKEYYIRGDIHWNKYGHKLVAQELFKHLGE